MHARLRASVCLFDYFSFLCYQSPTAKTPPPILTQSTGRKTKIQHTDAPTPKQFLFGHFPLSCSPCSVRVRVTNWVSRVRVRVGWVGLGLVLGLWLELGLGLWFWVRGECLRGEMSRGRISDTQNAFNILHVHLFTKQCHTRGSRCVWHLECLVTLMGVDCRAKCHCDNMTCRCPPPLLRCDCRIPCDRQHYSCIRRRVCLRLWRRDLFQYRNWFDPRGAATVIGGRVHGKHGRRRGAEAAARAAVCRASHSAACQQPRRAFES